MIEFSIDTQTRYYAPTLGCFNAQDTIRDGLNWYEYCRSNPLAFIDKDGCAANRRDLIYFDPFVRSEPHIPPSTIGPGSPMPPRINESRVLIEVARDQFSQGAFPVRNKHGIIPAQARRAFVNSVRNECNNKEV